MRTNIDIDDRLMSEAMAATSSKTKRAVVEEALRLLVRLRSQACSVQSLEGLGWEGDLDDMRRARPASGG